MLPEPRPKPLKHFLDFGVAVIPTTSDGPTLGSWKDPTNFTTDLDVVARHWKAGIRRFQFLPEAAGFVCFDIDRKNAKDGVRELYRFFTDAGVALPSYLLNLDTFPARTLSPSGGLHLYFRYQGTTRYRSKELSPGLEVVHSNHLLTAPGSEKREGPYRFCGDLGDAPALPPIVERVLSRYFPKPTNRPITWDFKRKEHGPLSLDDIVGVVERQGEYSPGSSRNRFCYEVARFARKKDYAAADVEAYLRGQYEAPDFDAREIGHCVRSAYERN